MTHKYELNRRYPFTATADSVCPVPDDAEIIVWIGGMDRSSPPQKAGIWSWNSSITHFLVTSCPKTKHKVWVNCNSDGRSFQYLSRADADFNSSPDRVECVEIEWGA